VDSISVKSMAGPPAYLQSPLVSVVIPCFNHGRYLSEAVQSALGQTYPSVEVVVVDDGSSDNTAEVAQSFPEVRYLLRARGGLAAARNAGLQASQGAYLVFLDADDRLLPNAVEVGLAAFAQRPHCGFVYGAHRWITIEGTPTKDSVPPLADDHYEALLRRNFIDMQCHGAVPAPCPGGGRRV
jgi:glycosyltransferase involved in cell wall biosynthesis